MQFQPNGSPLRWRHLTEISKSACWTMMVSSIRSHLRVTGTDPIGSTLGVKGMSISTRPIGAIGGNSASRRVEQPRKLQDDPSPAAARYALMRGAETETRGALMYIFIRK